MRKSVLLLALVCLTTGCATAPVLGTSTEIVPVPPQFEVVPEPLTFYVAPEVAPAANPGPQIAPQVIDPAIGPVPPAVRLAQQVAPRPHAITRHPDDAFRVRREMQGDCESRVRLYECYRNSATGEPSSKLLFVCEGEDQADVLWAFDNGERLLEGSAYSVARSRLRSILWDNLCYEVFYN